MNQNPNQLRQHEAVEPTEAASSTTPERAVDVSGATSVMLETADISAQAAEVLGGAESAESAEGAENEKGFGEEEDQSKGKASAGGGGAATTGDDDDDDGTYVQPIPPPAVMQKEVAQALRKEIRKQEREVVFAYVGLKKVQPNKLAEMVSHLRQLKNLLGSLADMATDAMKGLYMKWVRGESK